MDCYGLINAPNCYLTDASWLGLWLECAVVGAVVAVVVGILRRL